MATEQAGQVSLFCLGIGVLLLIGTACGLTSRSGPSDTVPQDEPSSGVFGTVTRGPLCPDTPDPCPEEPLQDVPLEVFDSESTKVAETVSGEEGQFRVALPAGEYRIVARITIPPAFDDDAGRAFTVEAEQWSELHVRIDTGIRARVAPPSLEY